MLVVCVPLLKIWNILSDVDACSLIYVNERVRIDDWTEVFLVVLWRDISHLHPNADQVLRVYAPVALLRLAKAVVVSYVYF
jgi:hypothetical protein